MVCQAIELSKAFNAINWSTKVNRKICQNFKIKCTHVILHVEYTTTCEIFVKCMLIYIHSQELTLAQKLKIIISKILTIFLVIG